MQGADHLNPVKWSNRDSKLIEPTHTIPAKRLSDLPPWVYFLASMSIRLAKIELAAERERASDIHAKRLRRKNGYQREKKIETVAVHGENTPNRDRKDGKPKSLSDVVASKCTRTNKHSTEPLRVCVCCLYAFGLVHRA